MKLNLTLLTENDLRYSLLWSKWRKVQALGLTEEYHNNEEFKLFVGQMDGLAFLRLADVQQGMLFLRNNMPNVDGKVFDYFYHGVWSVCIFYMYYIVQNIES